MKIRIAFEISLTGFRKPEPDEPEQFEHRDNDTAIERAEPHPIGFRRADEVE